MSGQTDHPIRCRPALVSDAEAVAVMAGRLRAMVGDPTEHLTAEAIRCDGFGARPEFGLIIAERESLPVGYALHHDAYEPAYAARGLYLADLYVEADARRCGVGRRLVAAVGEAARARGRAFVWWVARQDNVEALAFYRRLAPDFTQTVVAHALLVERAQ